MSDTDLQWGGETTDTERTMALVAHLGALFMPVILPFAVYFIKKDESKFIGYHALQAGIFQIVAWALGSVTCGVGLVLLVMPIFWGLKAHKGEWTGYPLIDGVGRS